MLPLLLREWLGIAKGGPNGDAVGFKVVSVADGRALLELSKSDSKEYGRAAARPFSKNGREVKA